MKSGDDYLQLAADDAAKLHQLDAERAETRASFLQNILNATSRGKTQQQVADRSNYSRQRIAQFLKEARAGV